MESKENSIIRRCVEQLKAVAGVDVTGQVAEFALDRGFDLALDVSGKGATAARYIVEVKTRFNKMSFELIRQRFLFVGGEGARPLLFADFISRKLAEQCRAEGVEFVDSVGNMFINLDWLKVYVVGNENDAKVDARGSLASVAAMKITYALLVKKDSAGVPLRDMARWAGVSLGSVAAVYKELRAQGFLRVRGGPEGETRDLLGMQRLFDRWIAGYEDRLRRKLVVGVYRTAGGAVAELPERLAGGGGEGILIGGELGATLLERGMLHAGAATLHISDTIVDARKLAVQLRLIPDKGGNVTFLKTFGDLNGGGGEKGYPELANPLLLYAELLRINDPRTREFTEKFHSARIKGVYGA